MKQKVFRTQSGTATFTDAAKLKHRTPGWVRVDGCTKRRRVFFYQASFTILKFSLADSSVLVGTWLSPQEFARQQQSSLRIKKMASASGQRFRQLAQSSVSDFSRHGGVAI